MSNYPMEPGQTRHAPPLSMFRRAGDLVFVSGHGAVDESGAFAGESFEEQFRYTMGKLGQTLQEAGVSWSQVVKVNSYVADAGDLPLYNRLYREYFSAPFPARTTVTDCLPPGLLFEIECVASVE